MAKTVSKEIMKAKIAKRKRERFERWAESRVRKAILALRRVRQMGNRNVWDYKKEEADKILARLKEEVMAMENFFSEDTNAYKFQL